METKKFCFRFLKIAGILILCLLMLAAFSVYLIPHFGWRIDGLRSGSMEPELKTGDMVITQPISPEAVAVGDIITFHHRGEVESLISHRVIGIQANSPLVFKTKGDANADSDPFITPARDLVGRVSFHFPVLGYAVLFFSTPLGLIISLVIPGFIIFWLCLNSLRNELKKEGES